MPSCSGRCGRRGISWRRFSVSRPLSPSAADRRRSWCPRSASTCRASRRRAPSHRAAGASARAGSASDPLGAHPSFGSRQSVRQPRLPSAARCGRDRLQHEPPRQLLGQCGRRELLRYAEDRTRFELQQARCHAAAQPWCLRDRGRLKVTARLCHGDAFDASLDDPQVRRCARRRPRGLRHVYRLAGDEERGRSGGRPRVRGDRVGRRAVSGS